MGNCCVKKSLKLNIPEIEFIEDGLLNNMRMKLHATNVRQIIRIGVSCQNLTKLDKETSIFANLSTLKGYSAKSTRVEKNSVGQTECIQDNLSPEFQNCIEIEF